MPIIFVGNKKDLVEKGEAGYKEEAKDSTAIFKQIQEISNANGYLRPLECSAKTGANVQRIFSTIGHELVRRKHVGANINHPNVVRSRQTCSDVC